MEIIQRSIVKQNWKPQNRAEYFLFNDNDSTYEDLLEKHGCPKMHIRRQGTLCIEIYKVK